MGAPLKGAGGQHGATGEEDGGDEAKERATAAKPEEKKKTSGSMRPMAVNAEEPVIEEGADGEDPRGR